MARDGLGPAGRELVTGGGLGGLVEVVAGRAPGRIDLAERRSFPVFQFRSLAASIYRRRGCNAGKLKCCNSARQSVGWVSGSR